MKQRDLHNVGPLRSFLANSFIWQTRELRLTEAPSGPTQGPRVSKRAPGVAPGIFLRCPFPRPWKGMMWPLLLQPWSSLGQSPIQRSTVALDNCLSPTLYLTAEQLVLAGRAQDWVTPSEKIAGPLTRNAWLREARGLCLSGMKRARSR